jgi:hypothetical protein
MFHLARPSIRVGVLLLACGAGAAVARGAEGPVRVEYNRDVRPILSDRCFPCHDPDIAHREAGLRLDRRDEAVAARDGERAIVPGDPEESEVVFRITAEDDVARMPPHDSGPALPAREVELLRRWIDQGAEFQPHWSFLPPGMPSPPPVGRGAWPRNPIDSFFLAELGRRGLAPAPEAGRANLLRRVSDVHGLVVRKILT